MPATRPFRLAIAGLSHAHIQMLERSTFEDYELVGIYEPDEALLKAYAARRNLPKTILFTNLAQMLRTKPEGVAAFGPIFDHLAVVRACAPLGIHVMVEKPLSFSLDHALEMAKLAKKHKIHLLTNYETTWYPTTQILDARIQDGSKPRKVVIHDGHRGPAEIGCPPEFLHWLTDPALSGGGALTDFGCYGANLMTRFMQGKKPLRVFALTHSFKPELYPNVEDDATILLSYADCECVIQASWNWPVSRKDIEIYRQGGYIIAADATTLKQRANDATPEQVSTLPPLKSPLDDCFAYFAAVVRGDITLEPTDLSALANNLTVMEILDAAQRSVKEGRMVEL